MSDLVKMVPLELVTEPIHLAVIANQPFIIRHGLGRAINGCMVIWADGPCSVWVADPLADTRQEIAFVCNASVDLRLVLL